MLHKQASINCWINTGILIFFYGPGLCSREMWSSPFLPCAQGSVNPCLLALSLQSGSTTQWGTPERPATSAWLPTLPVLVASNWCLLLTVRVQPFSKMFPELQLQASGSAPNPCFLQMTSSRWWMHGLSGCSCHSFLPWGYEVWWPGSRHSMGWREA